MVKHRYWWLGRWALGYVFETGTGRLVDAGHGSVDGVPDIWMIGLGPLSLIVARSEV